MVIIEALLIGMFAVLVLELVIPFLWGLTKVIMEVLISVWVKGYGQN